jgi:hypothetical protein
MDTNETTYGPDTEARRRAWQHFTDAVRELARDIPSEQLDKWFEDCLKGELDEIQMQIERQREK